MQKSFKKITKLQLLIVLIILSMVFGQNHSWSVQYNDFYWLSISSMMVITSLYFGSRFLDITRRAFDTLFQVELINAILIFFITYEVRYLVLIVIILFLFLYGISKIIQNITEINEYTFHKFFFRVNPKVTNNELVRLYLIPPANMTNTIFQTKQELYKTLHSFGGVVVGVGEFVVSSTFKTKGADIWKKYFESKKQIANQISVGFVANKDEIKQFIDVPIKYKNKISQTLKKTYLGMQIDETYIGVKSYQSHSISKGYIHGDWRSRLKTFKDEQVDPLNSMIQSLENIPANAYVEIKYNLTPLGDFYNAVVDEKLESEPIDKPSGGAKSQGIQATSQDKARSFLFKFGIEINCYSELKQQSDYIINDIQSSYLPIQEVEKTLVSFEPKYKETSLNQSVVSDSDLWSLWHIVSNSPKINVSRHIPLPYPNELMKVDKFATVIGKSNYPNFEDKTVGIATIEDKFTHTTILGRSGSGKSTLEINLFKQDCEGNFPMFFVDFKGETAPKILNHIPESRIKDVIYISPKDNIIPMAIFDGDPNQILLLLDILDAKGNVNIIGGFGNKIERNANVLASIISENKISTVRGMQNYINEILNSKQDIKSLKMSNDMRIKLFGTSVDVTTKQKLVDYLSSTIHSLDNLLVDDICIQSMDNPNAKLNFRDCITENKIVIINLPETESNDDEIKARGIRQRVSLGIFYTLKILNAIKSQSKSKQKQTAFYIDEAQVIMGMLSEHFESSFSQLRSAQCAVTIANQYISQTTKEVANSIKSNVGTQIVLGGPEDEQIIEQAKNFGINTDLYSSNNFRFLPRGSGFVQTTCNGTLIPCCTFTFDKITTEKNNYSKIIKSTKKLYYVKDYAFVPQGIKKTTNRLLEKESKIILTRRPERRYAQKVKSL